MKVSVTVIGKTAFHILPCLLVVYILVGIRQLREVVIGEVIAVLRAVACRVALVLPLPRGDVARIGWRNIIYASPLIIVVQRHIEQFAVLLRKPALNIVFHRLVNGVRSCTIGLSRELTDSIVAVSHHGQFAAVHLCRLA